MTTLGGKGKYDNRKACGMRSETKRRGGEK
jgi:hypothetical protein